MKLTKKHLKLLEKVFTAEIEGRLPFQSKAKGYTELEALGLVAFGERELPGWPPITVSGWYLTDAGRLAYCESCNGVEDAKTD